MQGGLAGGVVKLCVAGIFYRFAIQGTTVAADAEGNGDDTGNSGGGLPDSGKLFKNLRAVSASRIDCRQQGRSASSAAKAGEQDSTRLAAVSIFRKEVCMIRSCLLVSCARIVQRRRKAETSSSEARAMIFHRHSFFCQWDCFRCTGMSCCCRMRRTGQRGNSGKGRPGRCETPSVGLPENERSAFREMRTVRFQRESGTEGTFRTFGFSGRPSPGY